MKNFKAITGETKMKNGMKTKAVLVLAALAAMMPSLVLAGAGKSGAQFLRVGVGARAAGMGGAFSPIADDVTAIYWNPAGLSMIEQREASLSYNAYFVDTAGQFAGYAHPFGNNRGVLGAGLSLLSVSDIEKRSATAGDADAPDLGTFNTQDMALSLGWANKLDLMGAGNLNFGMAAKYISSDLDTAKANTVAADLGAILSSSDQRFFASLAVLNVGGELKFVDEGDPLPLNIKPGFAYKTSLERYGKLTLALDADILVNDSISYVNPGFEWWFYKGFAFRGGYQIGRATGAGSGLALGVGLRQDRIGIDYGFVPFGDLGNTHRVSLGYRF